MLLDANKQYKQMYLVTNKYPLQFTNGELSNMVKYTSNSTSQLQTTHKINHNNTLLR